MKEMFGNFNSLKLKSSALQKMLLREWKHTPKTGKNVFKRHPIEYLHLKYIENKQK